MPSPTPASRRPVGWPRLSGHGTPTTRVRYAAVNGTQLPYRDEGQGPPVLLIHGHGGGWWAWNPLIDELASDHRVIAYSRRGYSGAGELATAWDQHREDAAALLEHLDARGALVVAWSGSGPVAAELAAARPDLVTGLVLVEAPLQPHRNHRPESIRLLLAGLVRRALFPDEQAIDVIYGQGAMRRDDGTSRWEEHDLQAFRFGHLATAGAAFNDLDLSALRRPLSPEEVARIPCPVTLLVGERTNPFFARHTDDLASIIPDARRVDVPNGDHAMPYLEPDGTAEAIRRATSELASAT